MNVITSIACVFSSFLVYADQPPGTVIVKTLDGKPAEGASVWVYPEPGYMIEPKVEPAVLKTDANGSVVALKEKELELATRVYVQDGSGRIGMAWLNPAWEKDKKNTAVIYLIDNTPRTGQLTGTDGKPISGAKFTPTEYRKKKQENQGREPSIVFYPPPWAKKSLVATSDAAGKFSLPIPEGYDVDFDLEAPGYSMTTCHVDSGTELKIKLETPGTIILKGPKEAKGQNVTLSPADQKVSKTAFITFQKRYSATFDEHGIATLQNIMPLTYHASFDYTATIPVIFQPLDSLVVEPGKSVEVDAKSSPAAKVTGRMVAAGTGKGLAGVKLNVNVVQPQNKYAQPSFNVQTDQDGNYYAYGPAGNYHISNLEPPNGYATPRIGKDYYYVPPAKVDLGKTHTFEPIAFPVGVTFLAKIVDDKGKPVPEALYYHEHDFIHIKPNTKPNEIRSDKDGLIAIPNLPPDDSIEPRFQFGKAINTPETFVLEESKDRVTIVLSESKAGSFKGRITDVYGKPIANATVRLFRLVMGVGRNSQSGMSTVFASSKTDSKGEYLFQGLWTKDKYWLLVSAAGYMDKNEDHNHAKQCEAGTTITLADVKLIKNNLFVSGIVVGPDGRPIEGVELSSNDSAKPIKTKSLADGTFKLVGFDDQSGFLFAKKDGYRFESMVVNPLLKERVNVKLTIDDGKPVPFAGLPKEHLATQEQLLKTNLLKLWEVRGEIGTGASAIQIMSKLDPAIAKLWVEEEKVRSGGKNDYSGFIKRAMFEKMLDEADRIDADDIIAGFSPQNFRQNYVDAKRLAKQFLPTNKAKALRFVEEAVINARKREPHQKVIGLAEAGDLALQAGDVNGKKLIIEAAELAEKLDVDENGSKALAIGYVAAYLAQHDAKKADALLSRLTLTSDYNRYLGLMAKIVSRSDLPRALKLIEGMKPDNSFMPHIARMMVAGEIAKSKPDEAVTIVESIKDIPHRVKALAQLALLFAKSDQKRSIQLLDQAFALIEKDPNAFYSWSSYGAVSFAAMIAVTAKEVGHPDVTSLIHRTLALPKMESPFNSETQRENMTVNLATSLARIDPVTARKILLTIAPPEEFASKALTQSRDWLFALALADPELAKTLLPKIYDKIKNNRNSYRWQSSGLLELNSILSTPGQYQDLKHFGSIVKPLEGID